MTRAGAVKARTAAINQMRGLITAAPETLRAKLTGLSMANLVTACRELAYDPDHLDDPAQATAAALRGLAVRVATLTAEITTLDRQLRPLTRATAPRRFSCS